ncbi:hypothetical protein D3C73_1593490 [compost metagenome]
MAMESVKQNSASGSGCESSQESRAPAAVWGVHFSQGISSASSRSMPSTPSAAR